MKKTKKEISLLLNEIIKGLIENLREENIKNIDNTVKQLIEALRKTNSTLRISAY
jgi:hypothetical protein